MVSLNYIEVKSINSTTQRSVLLAFIRATQSLLLTRLCRELQESLQSQTLILFAKKSCCGSLTALTYRSARV